MPDTPRTDPLILGAGALAGSALIRVALPPSYDPESPAYAVADFLLGVTLWSGLLAVAASLLVMVLVDAQVVDRPAGVPSIGLGHLLPAAAALLVASLALRLAFRLAPSELEGRVVGLAAHAELVLFGLGLLCLAALALRLALTEGAERSTSP